MDVHIISVTDGWSQYAVAGPKSRDLLRKIVDDTTDISNGVFPFMACAGITVCGGIPARLFRISFSGELAYEIAVPSRYGDSMMRALMMAGSEFDVTPYGLEALSVKRIEKGHPVSSELTGQTTARDLGFGRMVSDKKDSIGHRFVTPARFESRRWLGVDGGYSRSTKRASLDAGAHFLEIDATTDDG